MTERTGDCSTPPPDAGAETTGSHTVDTPLRHDAGAASTSTAAGRRFVRHIARCRRSGRAYVPSSAGASASDSARIVGGGDVRLIGLEAGDVGRDDGLVVRVRHVDGGVVAPAPSGRAAPTGATRPFERIVEIAEATGFMP